MSKPFFEVFPSLQLNTDIRDLMGQTEVERVSATKRRDFLRVYLKSTRLIQKADIWTTEQEIKKQLFPQANLTVKIYEKFELSSQYNPEKLMDIYKESILEEFREYSHIQYNALKTAKIEYPSENEMLLTLLRGGTVQNGSVLVAVCRQHPHRRRHCLPHQIPLAGIKIVDRAALVRQLPEFCLGRHAGTSLLLWCCSIVPHSARIAKHHSVFSPPCRRRLMDAASSFLLSIQS